MAGRDRGLTAQAASRTGTAARPWSRADRVALGILSALLAVSLVWLVHPWSTPYVDAAIYVSTARALVSGDGYTYLGLPFQVRPPGFAALLTPVVATLGTSFRALNLWVAAFGCGAILLLFAWVRPRLGALLGLLVCVALGANPVFRRLSSEVLSDVPGLFFALAVLVYARRSEQRPSLRGDLLLALSVSAAAYVRTINVMLLPALLLQRLVDRMQGDPHAPEGEPWQRFAMRRLAPLTLTTFALLTPWVVRTQRSTLELPVDQLANHSYVTSMFHVDHGDPHSPLVGARKWKQRLSKRPQQVAASLATRMADPRPARKRVWTGSLLLCAYLVWLITTPTAAGFFVLTCLAVTGTYFAYEARLLLPVFALLLPALSEALLGILRRGLGARWATGLVALPLLGLIVVDFTPREGWPEMRARHERISRISAELQQRLPEDARPATGRGFHLTALMQRPVYSLRWAARLGSGMDGVEAVIERNGINTLLLDPSDPRDRRLEPEILARYGEGGQIGGLRVVRVR